MLLATEAGLAVPYPLTTARAAPVLPHRQGARPEILAPLIETFTR
jgi:hypothetical protein